MSVLLAVSNNLILHGFKNKGLEGMGDVLLFNAFISCIWAVILFGLNGFAPISTGAVGWGVLYGCVTAAFLLCKMQAMATGPVSLTTFVSCSSLLISTAFCVVYFGESVSVVQLIGLALLFAALFITVAPKGGQAQKSWKFWCILFLLFSGSVGIIFKLHQNSPVAGEVNGMMLTASLVSAALFTLSSLLISKRTVNRLPRVPKSALSFLLSAGIVSCGYNRLNITLSGKLPSIVFFPVFNGSVILLATLLGALMFKERVKPVQLFGLILGIAALMMASLG